MLSYIVRRILMLIPVLFGITLITFSIIHLIPGNAATVLLGDQATPESVARLSEKLGLNDPWYTQYANYLMNLFKGDLGESLRTNEPINNEIWNYLTSTLELSLFAIIIAVVIGINMGVISSWFKYSWFDSLGIIIALVGISVPTFWLGLLQKLVFSLNLGWLPSVGQLGIENTPYNITHFNLIDSILKGDLDLFVDALQHLILPGFTLAAATTAIVLRMTRSSMLDVMNTDYVKTAKAKGLKTFFVIYKHSLKNAMIPVLTVIGLQAGFLLGGAVLTETIFGWPGIGSYIYNAIQYRDYPVVQAGILVIATFFVLINLIVDLLYSFLDPRIKYR